MLFSLRRALPAVTASVNLLLSACSGNGVAPTPPPSPTPTVTVNAYILPDAVSLNDRAFGDEPVVIHKGERLRWVNADTLTHVIVADSPDATDFRKTDELRAGNAQSFIMTRMGTTRIHVTVTPT